MPLGDGACRKHVHGIAERAGDLVTVGTARNASRGRCSVRQYYFPGKLLFISSLKASGSLRRRLVRRSSSSFVPILSLLLP